MTNRSTPEPVAPTRRRFAREEYYRMGEAGILGEDDRGELIEGEIIQMSPIGSRHFAFVVNLARLLTRRLGDRAFVSVRGPSFSRTIPSLGQMSR